jgi:SAM-dependent methyltransferase
MRGKRGSCQPIEGAREEPEAGRARRCREKVCEPDWTILKSEIYYWKLWCDYYDPSDAEVRLISETLPRDCRKILEVGCGDGRLSIKLSSRYVVTGIDIDPGLIEEASHAATGIKNLEFKHMDGQRLRFRRSFDAVIYPWVVHLFPDRYKALCAAKKVLNPRGAVLIIGLHKDSDYERVIGSFTTPPNRSLNPRAYYEEPLIEIFGNVMKLSPDRGRIFSFHFPDEGILHEAFTYALENWHGIQMTLEGHKRLRQMIRGFRDGKNLRLKVRAGVYLAFKR